MPSATTVATSVVAEGVCRCVRLGKPDRRLLRASTVWVGQYFRPMPVDPMELLAWIADREDDYPGAWLDGTSLMQQTAGMAGSDGLPWEAVARAAATLRKRGYLDWDYDKWPNELQEPPPQHLDYMTFQRTKNITVSGAGYQALEARKAKSAATQINIINSTVGQVALRDVNNIDVFVILKAAEQALERIDAPSEAKDEARGAIRRMRDAGASALSSTASELLAAAVRQALGLP
jgi:hypothetical protein